MKGLFELPEPESVEITERKLADSLSKTSLSRFSRKLSALTSSLDSSTSSSSWLSTCTSAPQEKSHTALRAARG